MDLTREGRDLAGLSEEEIHEIWRHARAQWHNPALPLPIMGQSGLSGEFPFHNYRITVDKDALDLGGPYLENLFEHLIVHYIFCPRSLQTAGSLAVFALKGLLVPDTLVARKMVNIFTDIVVDSFRLERSHQDRTRVLLGWSYLAGQDLSPLDRAVVGFLSRYWGEDILVSDMPESDLLCDVFSPGVRNRSLWPRQCGQMARILEPLEPGILGRGRVMAVEMLNGSAHNAPLPEMAGLDFSSYSQALDVLGERGDLVRWYHDQSGRLEIRPECSRRISGYPSSPIRWRLSDPLSELDLSYSMSLSHVTIPGITTFRRHRERSELSPLPGEMPPLLILLDSSRSMQGHTKGTRLHFATLAAFKACEFAHSQGAEVAAINFSDTYLAQPWTRDRRAVEDVLVEYLCGRTQIPGKKILEMARDKRGCLILCITDTHIQNLHTEWDYLAEATKEGQYVLFCIQEDSKDKDVEAALAGLGRVYYIDSPADLVSLVIETAKEAFLAGESFISEE